MGGEEYQGLVGVPVFSHFDGTSTGSIETDFLPEGAKSGKNRR